MSIRKVKSGYQADYWPLGRHGPRIRETFPTREEARMAISKARAARPNAPPSDGTPIALCTAEFLAHVASFRTPAYARRCRQATSHLQDWFAANGIVLVNQLTMRALDAYFRWRRNHMAAAQTAVIEVRTLHAALEHARTRSIIATNPVHRYHPPERPIHHVPDVPMPHQIQAIFDHLSEPAARIIYFLLAHGSRFGETAALEATDIVNNTVTFRRAVKFHQNRTIKLCPLPFDLPNQGPLFLSPRGLPWQEHALLTQLQSACILAQVPVITLHTCRHAHATYSLAGGGPDNSPYELMNRCGWRSISMLDRYATIARKYAGITNYLPNWRQNRQNPQGVDTISKTKPD